MSQRALTNDQIERVRRANDALTAVACLVSGQQESTLDVVTHDHLYELLHLIVQALHEVIDEPPRHIRTLT